MVWKARKFSTKSDLSCAKSTKSLRQQFSNAKQWDLVYMSIISMQQWQMSCSNSTTRSRKMTILTDADDKCSKFQRKLFDTWENFLYQFSDSTIIVLVFFSKSYWTAHFQWLFIECMSNKFLVSLTNCFALYQQWKVIVVVSRKIKAHLFIGFQRRKTKNVITPQHVQFFASNKTACYFEY